MTDAKPLSYMQPGQQANLLCRTGVGECVGESSITTRKKEKKKTFLNIETSAKIPLVRIIEGGAVDVKNCSYLCTHVISDFSISFSS